MNKQFNHQLNFCYVTDDNKDNINCLDKSISSLFKYYFENLNNINIYVICIDSNSFNIINDTLKNKYNLNIIYLDKYISDELQFPINATNKYLGYGSMIRWYLPFVVNCNYMYYVDTDILFINNIYDNLINIDTSLLYKAYTTKVHNWPNYIPETKINAGFMFMNNLLYKQLNVFDVVKKYYIKNKDTIKLLNQSVYEYLITNLYKDICYIDNCKNINSNRFEDGYFINIYHDVGPWKGEFNLMYDIVYNDKINELYNYINDKSNYNKLNDLILNYSYIDIIKLIN